MDLGTQRTAISESAVMHDLSLRGYDVFAPTTGRNAFDLVAHKDGKLFRVQVKSCWQCNENGCYEVTIKTTRAIGVRKFDPNSCDILAIYLSHGEICYLNPKDVGVRSKIKLRNYKTKNIPKGKRQWLIGDLKNISA